MTFAEPPLAEGLLPLYPTLADLPEALREETLAEHAHRLRLPADRSLFNEGASCQALSGAACWGQGAVLHVTHQSLADELGAGREIVTRLLKRFKQSGWIAVARERMRSASARPTRCWG